MKTAAGGSELEQVVFSLEVLPAVLMERRQVLSHPAA